MDLTESIVLIGSAVVWAVLGGAIMPTFYTKAGRRLREGVLAGAVGGAAGSMLGNSVAGMAVSFIDLGIDKPEAFVIGGTLGVIGSAAGGIAALALLARYKPPDHILVFLLPGFVLYSLVMAIPLLDALRLSTIRVQENKEIYVGLENFSRLFGEEYWSSRLGNALENNIVFFIVHMLVQNPVALVLATILTRRGLKGVPIFRTMLFAPTTLSYVIVGFIWTLMLSPIWGILHQPAADLGLPTPLLGQEESALVTISLVSVWQFIGLPMMLFVAALLNIPDELLDAALVDGANAWRAFWYVRFPLILPTIGVVTMLTFVGNFNAFALIYTMEGALAGPNLSTDIMGTFFFRTTFGTSGASEPNFPMGTTIATVMFAIIGSGVMLYFLFIQRRLVRTER
jgi:raffinose/stachyose/melibiose transport system permease protein